jgi:uncharacterized membrane protein YeaQ/YmgE (transglycosylase-associated protein family)
MKTTNQRLNLPKAIIAGMLLALASLAAPVSAQNQTEDLVNQTKAAAQTAAERVQDAGAAAAEEARNVWSRISDSRLKNRTFDELLAWLIIGVMVGALAGMFTSPNSTGVGKLGRLGVGLAGAFLGGMIVRVMQIDFGWGPVLIRFEEVLFSIVGAVLLVVVMRLIRSKMRKSAAK